MVRIYTLTLAPSLDSATITPQIYPEGKLRCTAPVFEPGGGGINVARAIAHLGGSATAIFPAGGATGEHLVSLLADENVPVATVEAKDWTRQNLHVHVEASGEQYRFVMPGAALNEDEFRQLEEQVLEIESGAILVISGSLPPGVKLEKLTQLISAAQKQGIRCIVDSSGEALSAALAIVNSGKAKRVVVSLGPQGALGVDSENCIQVVPPPVKSQSTVGAGDSMVGAMTLKLAENASLEEMVRFGVAAGSAATLNQGTRLCSHDDTQKIYAYLSR